ncbi:NAD(+) synthase [Schaalia sp. 19OD2882]|uniref:NAD(+) synthase n=1 Tax=Schaalia sp. 19OD2882 TaxID=2794089 RepID=UPI001C1EACCB|nr:NAD(+) synthase [Schaalia sp. 19OD2882]QWW19190.1 NAD(+) synthase [Schaalia sp. 19OD2882]
MNFHSLYDQGFARVAAVTVPVHPAVPADNAREVIEAAKECHDKAVAVAVFPELCLSGYSIEDLLLQDVLLDEVDAAIGAVVGASVDLMPLLVVGAPVRAGGRLYNCALAIHRGKVLAVVPKTHLPTYREFYEKRHFAAPGQDAPFVVDASRWCSEGPVCPGFGPVLLEAEDVPGLVVAIEICEDMWVPVTPSSAMALEGATVVVNLSASPVTVGRASERELMTRSASARLGCAYVYTAAGFGESSTDLAWDGQSLIHEAGDLLARGQRFREGRQVTVADVDLDRLLTERARQGSFLDNRDNVLRGVDVSENRFLSAVDRVHFRLDPPHTDLGLARRVDRFPFVPDDPAALEQDCYEAYNIQVTGLVQRLKAIGNPKVVLGVSGGLDSTHALIVAAKAMDRLGRPRTDILTYTMPGFATSEVTKNNARELSTRLGVSFEEIDIRPAARQMLADMKHPYAAGANLYDVTFENVQAGLRTDYLFRLANHHGGIVLGTGDLSELALGWCTFGVGDHMAHYGVNAGVPKTMIQHLIRWVVSSGQFSDEVGSVLLSVLDQEISPELVPVAEGAKMQSTQDRIGPYNLQDFTLHHVLRRGSRPSKIAFLAWHAWGDVSRGAWPAGFPEAEKVAYSLEEIVRWEMLFLERFFTQQFKRSTLPNGPKVMAGGSLSPRGDWRMPSDVSGRAWVAELTRAVAGVPGSGVPAGDEGEESAG